MNESNIGGLSIRGIISIVVVLATCIACLWNRTDANIGILKDLAILILTFYFSQKSTQTGTQPTQTPTTDVTKTGA